MRILTRIILSMVFIVGCGNPPPKKSSNKFSDLPSLESEIQLARESLSAEALEYIESALDTVQVLHPIGDEYDWEEWRLAALERAHDAVNAKETYSSLITALSELPGAHSYFRKPDSSLSNSSSAAVDPSSQLQLALNRLQVEIRESRIGVVNLPGFTPQDSASSNTFASFLSGRIRDVASYGSCGWIIDLRNNNGGNMWPMIAGLGSIIGSGQIGSFVGREKVISHWYYENGVSRMDTLILSQNSDPYLPPSSLSVAVLLGKRTASSGEAVAVAFKGREDTKFFGVASAGATSSPMRIQLKDGAVIGFASVFFADRDGTVYSGPIEPDIIIEPSTQGESDRTLEMAHVWLLKQATCM